MPEPNCICKTCGKPFYTKPALIRLRNGGQHCSRACRFANPDSMVRGERHPAWKGDAAPANTKRERAQRRFPLGPCERCGKPATDRHHKDADTGNNSPENVQILCRTCHMELDGRLEKFRTGQKRKLTQAKADEIRARYDALARPGKRRRRGSVTALAKEFGVSPETVKLIGTRKQWVR
jgi:hypothetical protein